MEMSGDINKLLHFTFWQSFKEKNVIAHWCLNSYQDRTARIRDNVLK